MFQQDYLMRLIVGLAAAIRQALEKHDRQQDSQSSRLQLETAIGIAADMDADVLLALEPESVATMLLLGSLNDSVAEYIVHALILDSQYLLEDGYEDLSLLRKRQAEAIAESFNFPYLPERLDILLNPTGAQSPQERLELEKRYGAISEE